MAKQSYSIKGTNISNGDSVGNHIEQTVSVDDNILPAPQELAEYKVSTLKLLIFLSNRQSMSSFTDIIKTKRS